MKWKSTGLGEWFTRDRPWQLELEGYYLALRIDAQPEIRVHLVQLLAVEVTQGRLWATCHLKLADEDATTQIAIGGISNRQALAMQDVLVMAITDALGAFVADSMSDLEAWMDRTVVELQPDPLEMIRAPAIQSALTRFSPPSTPGSVGWDCILAHPLAPQARTESEAWPDWASSIQDELSRRIHARHQAALQTAVGRWLDVVRNIIGRERWARKGLVRQILERHPFPPAAARTGWMNPQVELEILIDDHNAEHCKNELEANRHFFATVETHPLNAEQIRACLVMDEAVMIVASAGSGKTSTLVAKTGYLLHTRLAAPEQILLLTYNKAAAEQLRLRLATQLRKVPGADGVEVMTFHAFGKNVLEACGLGPLELLSSDANERLREIVDIADALCVNDAGFAKDWNQLQRSCGHAHHQPQSNTPGPGIDKEHADIKRHVMLAGPAQNIAERMPDGHEAIPGSDLDQSACDWRSMTPLKVAELLMKLVTLGKTNNLVDEQLYELLDRRIGVEHPGIGTVLRKISKALSQRRTTNQVDFEDMVIRAAECIENGTYQSPYSMILVDEFQDCSRSRLRLLKALVGARPAETHLCVVGDDWQGINEFAGSDVSIMLEFSATFMYSSELTLETTFRCPQALCDAAGAFIQANPLQLRKTVRSANPAIESCMRAFGFADVGKACAHLEQELRRLYTSVPEDTCVSVLLLGRYRDDAPEEVMMGAWRKAFNGRLKIWFSTVHAAKGLEADHVYVLNVVEGRRGFPSRIQDHSVLEAIKPTADPYTFAQERRLFYVAMTRARRQVTFYTSLARPSRFVVELVRRGYLEIESMDGSTVETCPECGNGVLQERRGRYGGFHACSLYPECSYRRKAGRAVST